MSVDSNAAAPVHPAAWDAYAAHCAIFADPAAPHAAGRAARQVLEDARARVAEALGAQAHEIIFTSGGTESDALALGLAAGHTIVTSSIEHAAIARTAAAMAAAEYITLQTVQVPRTGCLQPDALRAALTPQTRLVSIVHASNETGVLQPIEAIAALCAERGIWSHTDAVQAVGRQPYDVRALNVAMLSLSGHKLGAVGGIGALYVREGMPRPVHAWQQAALCDTRNVAGAASLAAALSHAPDAAAWARVRFMRDAFEQELRAALPDIEVLGAAVARLPNTSCIRFPGCIGEGLMIGLDVAGYAVSTGSACSSGSIEPSPILMGMGLSKFEALQTVRFSFGTTMQASQAQGLAKEVTRLVRRTLTI